MYYNIFEFTPIDIHKCVNLYIYWVFQGISMYIDGIAIKKHLILWRRCNVFQYRVTVSMVCQWYSNIVLLFFFFFGYCCFTIAISMFHIFASYLPHCYYLCGAYKIMHNYLNWGQYFQRPHTSTSSSSQES